MHVGVTGSPAQLPPLPPPPPQGPKCFRGVGVKGCTWAPPMVTSFRNTLFDGCLPSICQSYPINGDRIFVLHLMPDPLTQHSKPIGSIKSVNRCFLGTDVRLMIGRQSVKFGMNLRRPSYLLGATHMAVQQAHCIKHSVQQSQNLRWLAEQVTSCQRGEPEQRVIPGHCMF